MVPVFTSQKPAASLASVDLPLPKGAYQRRHAVLRDGQTDAVQDLLVVVVSEGYVPELDAVSVKGDRRLTVGLLLCLEYLVHLRHRGTHLRQRVHEVECGHDGRGHAQRQDDDRDECLRRQGAAHLIGGLHRTSKVSGVPAYGVSMGAWLTHRRMDRAAELLLGDPQASIAEIGSMVGYDSASKFAAAFKKAMKLTLRAVPLHAHRHAARRAGAGRLRCHHRAPGGAGGDALYLHGRLPCQTGGVLGEHAAGEIHRGGAGKISGDAAAA